MSTSIFETLYSAGEAVTGVAYRMLAGLNPAGNAAPLKTNIHNSLYTDIGPKTGLRDIFSRLRVSQPYALLDLKQSFGKNDLQFVESLTGGATVTYLPDEASCRLTVTTASGDSVVRQSRQYAPYQPGRTQYSLVTGTFGAAVANVRRRMGYFDADNGIYLQQTSSAVSFVLRSFTSGAAVETVKDQSTWNIDPLDGTGPSGLTLDLTKFTIAFIEFGWLGGAGVRVGFFIGGMPVYAHSFDFTGNTTIFMTAPSLPLRWEITNTAASAGATMLQTCGAVFSEGGFDVAGAIISEPLYSTRAVSATRSPIIAVRLKTAYNRGLLEFNRASAQVTTNDTVIVDVVIRGTVTGGTWVDSDSLRTEVNKTCTGITGGIKIGSFLVNNTASDVNIQIRNALSIAATFAGTADTIALVARTLSGNASVLATLSWREII